MRKRNRFMWCGKIGFSLNPFFSQSFSRFDPKEGSFYGPYTLWFEKKFLFIYYAVTPPYKKYGCEWV